MWPVLIKRDLCSLIRLALPLILTGIVGASIGFFQTVFLAHLSMVFVLSTYLLANKQYQVYLKYVFKIDKPFYVLELLKVGLPMGIMYCFEVGFFFALTLMMGSLTPSLLFWRFNSKIQAIIGNLNNH